MPNPTPRYRVKFDGNNLPGYVQTEDLPLTMRNALVDILNRDGGEFYSSGATFRQLTLNFRVLTRLDSGDGLDHLGDCLEQYRDALRYSTRVESASTLFLGDTSHWLVARFRSASAPLNAPDHRAINYDMTFDVTPYFLGPAISSTDSISGNDTITLNMTDTRKTYPVISIPAGITAITISHAESGKSFTFSGTNTGGTTVDCGRLIATRTDTGANRVSLITSGPDFGIHHTGSGSFVLDVTSVTGSGNVVTTMNPRLER